MMFHRHPRLLIDSKLIPMSDTGEPDIDLFVKKMVKIDDELKDKGSANISKAQQDQREYYDKRHSPEVCVNKSVYFHAGVTVWYKSLGRKHR